LKLLPLPKKSISLLVPFGDFDAAISAVPELMKLNAVPTAVEFMERDVILAAETYLGKSFPEKDAAAYLLLTYDGMSKAEIEAVYPHVADACFAKGGADLFIIDTDERKDSVWPARSAFLEAIKASTDELDECDVVVPKGTVADFLRFTYALGVKYDIRVKCFGHAGDGNLHVYALRDRMPDEVWKSKLNGVFDELYQKAFEFGGKVSGEHGIGLVKSDYFAKSESQTVINLMKAVKTAFDPNNILNPGKIFV